jgi:hypothetical protein
MRQTLEASRSSLRTAATGLTARESSDFKNGNKDASIGMANLWISEYSVQICIFLFKRPLDGEINILMTSGQNPYIFSYSVIDFTN